MQQIQPQQQIQKLFSEQKPSPNVTQQLSSIALNTSVSSENGKTSYEERELNYMLQRFIYSLENNEI